MARNSRWGIDWERVPWTLWAYVAISVADLALLLTRLHNYRPAIYAVILILVWNYFLLRRVYWLWVTTVVFTAAALLFNLVTADGSWWGDGLGIVELSLLLLPPSWRYFNDRR